MSNNLTIARNLGFIAKLNKVQRSPSEDKNLWQFAINLGKTSNPNYFAIVRAWKEGWDSANTEYKKYNRKFKN
jgi:hypothetical protein